MNKTYQISVFILLLIFNNVVYSQQIDLYWAKAFGNDNFDTEIRSLTTDKLNNILLFTDFENQLNIENNLLQSEGGSDLAIISLNESGDILWILGDGGENDQIAQKILCDAEGNIYIMGKFNQSINLNGNVFSSNGTFDMFLAKYSGDGIFQWLKTFGGPNSESFEDIKITTQSILLAGRFYDYTIIENDTLFSYDGTDLFVMKLDFDGNVLSTFSAGGEGVDVVSGISADAYGNVYLAGDFYKTIHFGNLTFDAGDKLGLYLAKLNSSLQLQWAYEFVGDDLKPGIRIATSPSGDIFATGAFSSQVVFNEQTLSTNDFDEDIYFAKFSSSGSVLWAQRFFSNSMESVVSLFVDDYGKSYLSGHYLDHIHFGEVTLPYTLCCGSNEIFMVEIQPDGMVNDARTITGERSLLVDMSVPHPNHLLLAGQFSNQIEFEDFVLDSPYMRKVFLTYYKDNTWLNELQQAELEHIQVYPTISNNYFNVFNPKDNSPIQRVEVYNYCGQLIERIETVPGNFILGTNYNSGVYYLIVAFENGKQASFIVTKT